MIIFISYNSSDHDMVQGLAGRFGILEHDVQLDQKALGADIAWSEVFRGIENCDAFVFAVSQRSLDSTAEQVEYRYASAWGKPILPVLLEDIDTTTLPPELSVVPALNYPRGNPGLWALKAALKQLPPPGSPVNPFAMPPTLDATLGDFQKKVRVLSGDRTAQFNLFYNVREFLERSDTYQDATHILLQLQSHPRVSKDVVAEIEKTFREVRRLHSRRTSSRRVGRFFKGIAALIAFPVLVFLFMRGIQFITPILNNDSPTPITAAAQPSDLNTNPQDVAASTVTTGVFTNTPKPNSNETFTQVENPALQAPLAATAAPQVSLSQPLNDADKPVLSEKRSDE